MVIRMSIVQIGIIAIIGVILSLILKNYKPEYSIFIGIVVSLFIFTTVLTVLSEVKYQLSELSLSLGNHETYYVILFKILGITYLCEFSSNICKDAGYQSIAGQVELFGKLTVLLSGMPIIQALLSTINQFLG